jgi:hypothetical protein
MATVDEIIIREKMRLFSLIDMQYYRLSWGSRVIEACHIFSTFLTQGAMKNNE